MAIQIQNFTQYDLFDNPDNACDVKYIDTPIQGHLVKASLTLSEEEFLAMFFSEDNIKKRLVHMIAKGLIDTKLIAFTKTNDISTGMRTFYARGFLVPNDKVRLIRTLVK